MDNQGAAATSLPKTKPFVADATRPALPPAETTTPTIAGEAGERNGVFRHLVKDDTDIAGLVAYSIYKQNKLDWLTAFEAAKKRVPNEGELSAYIIGEETPRRLATYRHLAEATLAGQGPDVEGAGSRPPTRRRAPISALSAPLVVTYVTIAILFLIGFWMAAHFTMVSR